MAEQGEGNIPRENLIETAIKFLQNPKVRDSPFASRKTFLQKKGLTDEEIDIAIGRSGTAGDEALQQQKQTLPSTSQALTPIGAISPQHPIESKWTRVKDYTATAIVFGGIGYAIYIIYKKYIIPYFYGPSQEERQFQQLSRSITQLQETMAVVVRTMEETQRVLSQQQENLQQIASSSSVNRTSSDLTTIQDSYSINELKEEVKSLKGLLLSRKQFPQAPPSTPVIPSWQLSATTTSQTATSTSASDSTVQADNKDTLTATEIATETPVAQNGISDSKSDDELIESKSPENLATKADAQEEHSENKLAYKKDEIFTSESEDNTQIQKQETVDNHTEESVVTK